jgi:hypothetical protein
MRLKLVLPVYPQLHEIGMTWCISQWHRASDNVAALPGSLRRSRIG